MAGKKHIHKYYRNTILGNIPVWACALDNCSHYMPPHIEGLVRGKSTVCWKCNEITTMDLDRLDMEKPLCDKCLGKVRTIIDEEAGNEITSDISPRLMEYLRQQGIE